MTDDLRSRYTDAIMVCDIVCMAVPNIGVDIGIAGCGAQSASADTRRFLNLHTPADVHVRELAAGGALGFNQLVADSTADVLVLLDRDALVGPGWLPPLLNALTHQQFGLAGPSTNRAWNEQGVMPTGRPELSAVRRAAAMVADRYGATVTTLAPLYSLGAFCYAVRRDVVTAIGPADPAYAEGPCWEMDYNIRAARAGFDGVWVRAAYVYRPAMSPQAQREEARLLDRNRRLYQDRFCGLRARGELTEYRSHCLGDACEHFAPTSRRVAAPVRAEPSAPLVSCLMVTKGRPDFAVRSAEQFLAQHYPNRELIIVEDGNPELAQRLPDDPRIRLVSTGLTRSIGAMRNHSAELAHGAFLMLWDDDDWHGPQRIITQLAPLLANRAELTALTDLTWLEIDTWRAWHVERQLSRRLLLNETYAGTVAFSRQVWERGARFGKGSVAEDAEFMRMAMSRGARLEKLRGEGIYVYVRHSSNSWQVVCGQTLAPRGWRPVPVPDLPAEDIAFLRGRQLPPCSTEPLVSCIMPTHNRRHLVDHAITYFLRQTWGRRELVVVDDGTDPVDDLVARHAERLAENSDGRVTIHYQRIAQRLALGAKRNLAVELSTGNILAHWDDDDWYPPDRLAMQMSRLSSTGASLCGTSRIPFYDVRRQRAMEYRRPPRSRPWLAGTSLLYRRTLWETNRFADIATGEDTRFVWQTPADAITSTENPHVVALVHPGNTVPKTGQGSCWTSIPVTEIEALLGADMEFYRSLTAAVR